MSSLTYKNDRRVLDAFRSLFPSYKSYYGARGDDWSSWRANAFTKAGNLTLLVTDVLAEFGMLKAFKDETVSLVWSKKVTHLPSCHHATSPNAKRGDVRIGAILDGELPPMQCPACHSSLLNAMKYTGAQAFVDAATAATPLSIATHILAGEGDMDDFVSVVNTLKQLSTMDMEEEATELGYPSDASGSKLVVREFLLTLPALARKTISDLRPTCEVLAYEMCLPVLLGLQETHGSDERVSNLSMRLTHPERNRLRASAVEGVEDAESAAWSVVSGRDSIGFEVLDRMSPNTPIKQVKTNVVVALRDWSIQEVDQARPLVPAADEDWVLFTSNVRDRLQGQLGGHFIDFDEVATAMNMCSGHPVSTKVEPAKDEALKSIHYARVSCVPAPMFKVLETIIKRLDTPSIHDNASDFIQLPSDLTMQEWSIASRLFREGRYNPHIYGNGERVLWSEAWAEAVDAALRITA